jgi:hypothetical protein
MEESKRLSFKGSNIKFLLFSLWAVNIKELPHTEFYLIVLCLPIERSMGDDRPESKP